MNINELVYMFDDFSQNIIAPNCNNYSALYSKGGWEGWAQVEAAKYFATQGIPIDRELNVKGKRIDLYIAQEWLVELKCQSIQNSEKLIPGVVKDMIKLEEICHPKTQKAVIFWAQGDIGDIEDVNCAIQEELNTLESPITYECLKIDLPGGWSSIYYIYNILK